MQGKLFKLDNEEWLVIDKITSSMGFDMYKLESMDPPTRYRFLYEHELNKLMELDPEYIANVLDSVQEQLAENKAKQDLQFYKEGMKGTDSYYEAWCEVKVDGTGQKYLESVTDGKTFKYEQSDSSITDGKKHDGGKPRLSLVSPEFLLDLIAVLEFGAEKYGPNQWQKVEPVRYQDALFRHLMAYIKGETIDPESGLPHMAHVAANTYFLHYFGGKGE